MKDKDINRFSNECREWVLKKHGEYKDPLMMGGVMMKATMELYLSSLSDEDIHSLLEVVAESVPQIRRQLERNNQKNRVLH